MIKEGLEAKGAICCFCGQGIEPRDSHAGHITVRLLYPKDQKAAEPSQELYCHALCLRERVPPNTPLVLEVLDN